MPLFCFISFEKGLQTLIFLQWWLHFRFALCMLSDPVHLDPLPHPPPFAGSWSNPRPPVDVLASPRSPLYPIQHPSPNALSSPSPPLDLCLMCSAQLCVYAMYIVWTLLSTPSLPPAPPPPPLLSPLLASALPPSLRRGYTPTPSGPLCFPCLQARQEKLVIALAPSRGF